jgi:hypothetical protein
MAPVPPLLLAGIDRLSVRRTEHALESAGRVVMIAAHEMNESPEEVLATAQGPKELLAVGALNAGAATIRQDKIVALGRVLAEGLTADDEADLDETALTLAALADMEAPHIRVLAWFAQDDLSLDWWVSRNELTRDSLAQRFPEYGVALDGVLATLIRHGLVAPKEADLASAFEDYSRMPLDGRRRGTVRNQEPRWTITKFGVSVLRYLRAVEADDGEVGAEGGDD